MASHGLLYLPATSAKKDELLDLFYKEIIAKRKSILELQKNIKAKSDGIVFLDDSSRPSPKKPRGSKTKILDSTSDVESSPSPLKVDSNAIKRPETPLATSTYKLVSRLENLQVNDIPNKKKVAVSRHQLYINSICGVLVSASICVYLYFKFWFVWPVYTNDQLLALDPRPRLFLTCPYPKDSSIGNCLDRKLYCASGYVERKNLIGFGSSCIVDKERLSLIQSIKQKIVTELQTRLGMNLCYNSSSASVSKLELQKIISKYFKNMKRKTFTDYFDICLRSLTQEGTKIDTISR